jgi:uncharacterized oxidoreductase
MNLSSNKILITGGATGIGLGLTERFLQENNTVIVCGRRQEVLDELKEKFPAVIAKQCDLTNEKSRIDLYEWVAENHSDLNVLVNNAGIQQWTNITDDDFYDRAKSEIETNVIAPVHLTKLFSKLDSLTTFINVTSGLAFTVLAKVPVYCAAKSFFHSFTIACRHQLKDKNIEVIELIPPALNTDLGGKGLHDAAPPVSEFINTVFNQLKEGKTTATFGFSEIVSKASPAQIEETFKQMNP